MSDVPAVTAVVVNYNGRTWLERCLSSLLHQIDVVIEVILVDNASTDDSVAFVRGRFGRAVRIVQSAHNGGFAYGNQIGVASALHELILLINADAWLEPPVVSSLVRAQEDRDLEVIAPFEAPYDGAAERPGGSNYVTTIDYFGHPFLSSSPRWRGRPDFYLSGACLLFRRDFYLETGGLDSNFFMYCEEVDWFWRLNLMRRQFGHEAGLLVHHRGSEPAGLSLQYNVFRWRNQNTLQMLLKNYSPGSLAWVLPLYLCQYIGEALVFLMLGKPILARSYVEGLVFNARHLRRTLRGRKEVQRRRIASDREVRQSMYPGIAKLAHARSRLRST